MAGMLQLVRRHLLGGRFLLRTPGAGARVILGGGAPAGCRLGLDAAGLQAPSQNCFPATPSPDPTIAATDAAIVITATRIMIATASMTTSANVIATATAIATLQHTTTR